MCHVTDNPIYLKRDIEISQELREYTALEARGEVAFTAQKC